VAKSAPSFNINCARCVFDGALAGLEGVGNLFVELARDYQVEHIALTLRQGFQTARPGRAWRTAFAGTNTLPMCFQPSRSASGRWAESVSRR